MHPCRRWPAPLSKPSPVRSASGRVRTLNREHCLGGLSGSWRPLAAYGTCRERERSEMDRGLLLQKLSQSATLRHAASIASQRIAASRKTVLSTPSTQQGCSFTIRTSALRNQRKIEYGKVGAIYAYMHICTSLHLNSLPLPSTICVGKRKREERKEKRHHPNGDRLMEGPAASHRA